MFGTNFGTTEPSDTSKNKLELKIAHSVIVSNRTVLLLLLLRRRWTKSFSDIARHYFCSLLDWLLLRVSVI